MPKCSHQGSSTTDCVYIAPQRFHLLQVPQHNIEASWSGFDLLSLVILISFPISTPQHTPPRYTILYSDQISTQAGYTSSYRKDSDFSPSHRRVDIAPTYNCVDVYQAERQRQQADDQYCLESVAAKGQVQQDA